jgi:hypothetical protein
VGDVVTDRHAIVQTSSSSTSNISVAFGGITPAGTACTVAERGWDDQHARAADPHALNALVPAADHRAAPEVERERVVAVAARIELGSFAPSCQSQPV